MGRASTARRAPPGSAWIADAMRDTTQGAGGIALWVPPAMPHLRIEQGRLIDAQAAIRAARFPRALTGTGAVPDRPDGSAGGVIRGWVRGPATPRWGHQEIITRTSDIFNGRA